MKHLCGAQVLLPGGLNAWLGGTLLAWAGFLPLIPFCKTQGQADPSAAEQGSCSNIQPLPHSCVKIPLRGNSQNFFPLVSLFQGQKSPIGLKNTWKKEATRFLPSSYCYSLYFSPETSTVFIMQSLFGNCILVFVSNFIWALRSITFFLFFFS